MTGPQLDEAAALMAESLALRQELGTKANIAACLQGLAALATRRRQPRRAARLVGAAQALLRAIEAQDSPADLAIYNRDYTAAGRLLDSAAFLREEDRGKGMSLDAAISYALAQDRDPEPVAEKSNGSGAIVREASGPPRQS